MVKLYDDVYLERLQSFFNRTKQRSFELLKPKENETIVDVGCGVGTDAINLSQISGANVIGIDHDSNFIELAKENSRNLKVVFKCCEAHHTPFAQNSIDKVRFDRVLQHISNQQEVMLEAKRILKPKGVIQIVDTDYLGIKLFLKNKNLEEKLINTIAFERIPNGHTTRILGETLKDCGFIIQTKETHNYLINDFDFANYMIRFDKIVNEEFHSGNVSNYEMEVWQKNRHDFNLSLDLIIYQAKKAKKHNN